jgi:hypothetical protein
MKKRRRSEITSVSLSFLDCICCGFGGLILLFVLTKFGQPQALETLTVELTGLVARLQEELYQIRGETDILNRELVSKEEQLSEERAGIARLRGDLSDIQGQFAASQELSEVSDIIEGRLLAAHQELTEEMQRLLGRSYRRAPTDATVGGIPVDSEYIIFIIDTSGSMHNYAWSQMLEKMQETLNIYPTVKGIQVMNDEGKHLFTTYAGKWIPDTPGRRRLIIDSLRTWAPFSNSSPVEGIVSAIRIYAAPDKKISLYVLGDEFTGRSIEDVIETVDRINREDAQGNRLVRIHAIGFPTMFSNASFPENTGVRFASLMRELCRRNGGAFVGLSGWR